MTTRGGRSADGGFFSRRSFLGASTFGALCAICLASRCAALGDEAVTAPQVESVRAMGRQFVANSVGVSGMDGATSLTLPSDEALWVFGDTVEGPFESIRKVDLAPLRSNTGALVPQQDKSRGVKSFRFLTTADGKRPRQLVPFLDGEDPKKTRLWAIHGACVGRQAYLFYHRIALKPGVDVFADFALEGMGLARGDVEKLEFQRLVAPDGTREFWKGEQPTFGVWVERDGEYLYVWGSLMTGMFLARVRPEQIEELGAYEYLVEAPTLKTPGVKPQWEKKFAPTAVLFDSVPNEMSAAYNAHLGKYVAIHALGREGKIVMRTAPARTGPWSEPAVVYEAPRKSQDELIYAAKEHPELAREDGRQIYVTYVNSAEYMPEMVEIRFR